MNIYINIYKPASGKLLIAQGAQLVLSDDLERRDRWVGRMLKGEGICVYLRWIHTAVWQKLTQHPKNKVIIFSQIYRH